MHGYLANEKKLNMQFHAYFQGVHDKILILLILNIALFTLNSHEFTFI